MHPRLPLRRMCGGCSITGRLDGIDNEGAHLLGQGQSAGSEWAAGDLGQCTAWSDPTER